MIPWQMCSSALCKAFEGDGAFLLTKTPDGRTNPMTIGWAQVGIIWNRPVCTVFVRSSRYTYKCVTDANEFAVSVPTVHGFTKGLALCGSISGRDANKVADAALALVPGRAIDVPVIEGCGLQIECRIAARTQMLPGDLVADDVRHTFYSAGDEHLIVFGEIVAAYRNDSPETTNWRESDD